MSHDRKLNTHLNLGLLLLALSLLAACTGGPTSKPTTTPDLEGAYLEGMAEKLQGLDELFQTYNELAGPVFPRFAPDEVQARVLFNTLEEANLSERAADELQKFESLSPPARFAEDHAIFLEHLRRQISRAEAADDAIQRREMARTHLAMAESRAAFGVVRFAVSPEFCRYITPDRPPGIGPGADTNLREYFCSDEPIPGGEYGAAVTRLAETFNAEFLVRATFPPGMTPEELLEGLTYVQPAIVVLFNETLTGLDAIEPPPEYQVGHEVLHDYFSELLSTARAIDRAVADGDNDRVQREFDRSGQIARTADGRLPESYRPLVKVIFGATPGED